MLVGLGLGLLSGCCFAVFPYFLGRMTDLFVFKFFSILFAEKGIMELVSNITLVGVCAFVVNSLLFTIWKVISVRVADGWRRRYLEEYLSKRAEWI